MTRHPLQRFQSPSRTFSLVLHTAGLASFLMAFRFLSQLVHPISHGFGGNYQHLTNIGLALSFATFVAAVLADLTLSPALFRLKNFLSVTSAPLEVLITLLYWGIRAIDKKLLFPPDFELPLVPDLSFHLVPAVALTADLLLLSPPYTVPAYGAMAISMTIAFLYWGWVELCFSYNGWFVFSSLHLLFCFLRFSATRRNGSVAHGVNPLSQVSVSHLLRPQHSSARRPVYLLRISHDR